MKRFVSAFVVIGATFSLCSPVTSNDTAAELSTGGLNFTQSADVIMESEELKISTNRIDVRYRFRNSSSSPVTLTIAFPLPDIDLFDSDGFNLPVSDSNNFVGFSTKIDGSPVTFDVDQRAFVGKMEVTHILRQLNVPLLPMGKSEIRFDELSDPFRKRLIDSGLVLPAGLDERGGQRYRFAWLTKTSFVRKQSFPPDQDVTVEHSYRPSVGLSSDTILRRPLRDSKGLQNEVNRYRTDYCVTNETLAQLDRLFQQGPVQERRISYTLKTGANWAGPIRNFHLVIDPGAAGAIVSSCVTGQRREFRATNYLPDRDLKVLLLGKL